MIALLFICATPCAAAEKTIIAVADSWPPFSDSSEPAGGLSLEIIRAAYKTQGYQVTMEFVPWARAIERLKTGTRYDILPNTWMTEERKTFLMFSDHWAVNEIKFIKARGDHFEFTGIESLAGKTIGTIRGYGYGNEFMASTLFERKEGNKLIGNIKKLAHKRIDLVIEDEIVARAAIIKEDPNLMKRLQFTKNALSSNKLYVTSGLANPRHKELINAFNKGLAVIKANGNYARIMANYGMK